MPASAAAYDRWLRCAHKRCCAYYAVFPAGDEIVSIAAALGMPIDEIVMPVPSAPRQTAYRSGPDGATYRLALVRTRDAGDAPPTCGFLMRLPDASARCGLGALRPRRCQTYPATLRDGRIDADAAGCSCGPWSAADVDGGVEALLLGAAARAHARYAGVVEAWNAGRREASTHADFFAFLRAAYRG